MAKKQVRFWLESQTIVIVAVITALIWLYAEANTTQSKTIVVKVLFVQPPAKKLYIDQPAGGYDVRVDFRGTSEQISAVEKLVADPIELEITPTTRDGGSRKMMVPLADRIRFHEPLHALGVGIEKVEPASREVWVWELIEKTLSISAVPIGGVVFTRDPKIEPPEARIMLPVGLSSDDPEQIVLGVRIGPNAEQQYAPNVPYTTFFQVELEDDLHLLPPGYDPEPTPAKVVVTFMIKDQRATWTLGGVPVQVRMKPNDVGKYIIDMDDADRTDTGIELHASRELKGKIESRDLKIELVVPLSSKDLEKEKWEGNPTLILPHGVTSPTPPKRITMTFKAVPKVTPESVLPNGESEIQGAE